MIARNEPCEIICAHCGKNADYIDAHDMEYICDKCSDATADECYLLPITNSPRSGECGYDGSLDKWTYKVI